MTYLKSIFEYECERGGVKMKAHSVNYKLSFICQFIYLEIVLVSEGGRWKEREVGVRE